MLSKKNKIKILFRCNVGLNFGFGHVRRSLGIAKELKDRGHNVHFSLNQHCDFLEFQGESHKYYFPVTIEDEVVSRDFDVIIIDDKNQNRDLSSIKQKTIVIDNLCDSTLSADMVILPVAHANGPLMSKANNLYYGPEYVILRNEITSQNISVNKNGPVAITTGGTDPQGVLFYILSSLKNYYGQVKVLVGQNFTFRDKLQSEKYPYINFVDWSIKEFDGASVVISTFGVSIYEFLYWKLPVVSIGRIESDARDASFISEYVYNAGYYKHMDNLSVILNGEIYKKRIMENLDKNGIKRIADLIER